MEMSHPNKDQSDVVLPTKLNIGSGKDFRKDCLNLDYSDYWSPDVHADLSDKGLIGSRFETDRFGEIELKREMFDEIICNDVIEHIPDLVSAMTNCLNFLTLGGKFRIFVPYDLSFGAWQDPTHVRAFNERSWLYYTDWHWYIGWDEARFDMESLKFNISPLGQQLMNAGAAQDEMIRTPRAVDSMSVVLTKRELNANDRLTLEHHRSRR